MLQDVRRSSNSKWSLPWAPTWCVGVQPCSQTLVVPHVHKLLVGCASNSHAHSPSNLCAH